MMDLAVLLALTGPVTDLASAVPRCQLENSQVLAVAEVQKTHDEVLRKLQVDFPAIMGIEFETSASPGKFGNAVKLRAIGSKGERTLVGSINYDIYNGGISTDEQTVERFRNKGVNRLLRLKLFQTHPEVTKSSGVLIDTNKASFVSSMLTGKTGNELKQRVAEYEGNVGAKRGQDTALLQQLSKLNAGDSEAVKRFRARAILAAVEASPFGRTQSAAGFGHLSQVQVTKDSVGYLEIHVKFEKAEQNDKETKVLFVNRSAGNSTKELMPDGKIEYRDHVP